MELRELFEGYLTKLNTLNDLVDVKAAFEDEHDTLIGEYGNLARTSVSLASKLKEYKDEGIKSQELTNEIKVRLLDMCCVDAGSCQLFRLILLLWHFIIL